jgi:hypothetical protein
VKILHLQKKSFSSTNGFPSATGKVSADVELIVHCLIAPSKLVECGLLCAAGQDAIREL